MKYAVFALLLAPIPPASPQGALPLSLEWYAVPGSPAGPVSALLATDLGDGLALYVGGQFQNTGGLVTTNIARLGSAGWAPLGIGLNAKVNHLSTFDDGSGTKLVASGEFTLAGGIAAEGIAFWDGNVWSTPVPGLGIVPKAAVQFDGPFGPRLAVAGHEPDPFAAATPRALWLLDSTGWTAIDTFAQILRDLAVHDAGAGPELFGASSAYDVERWSDTAHSRMPTPLFQPLTLKRVPDGAGHTLLLGGMASVYGAPPHNMQYPAGNALARLGPNGWQAEYHNLGSFGSGSTHTAWAIEPWDGPFGPTCVVAGNFTHEAYSFVEVPPLVQRTQTMAGTGLAPLWVGVGNSPSGVHELEAVEFGGSAVLFAAGLNLVANGQSLGSLAFYGGGAQTLPSWESIPTCSPSLYTLRTFSDHAVMGTTLRLGANGPPDTWGVVAIALGTDVDLGPSGCGIELPGVGHWLLAGGLSGGSTNFWVLNVGPTYGASIGWWDWAVPADPALIGKEIVLQGLSKHKWFELYGTTNAMRIRVGM